MKPERKEMALLCAGCSSHCLARRPECFPPLLRSGAASSLFLLWEPGPDSITTTLCRSGSDYKRLRNGGWPLAARLDIILLMPSFGGSFPSVLSRSTDAHDCTEWPLSSPALIARIFDTV